MSLKAKILMVGPPQCGKTYISNILGDATESNGGEYHPTQGVRILEFDVDGEIVGDVVRVAVELWDCGGSTQFENCWPVFAKDIKGVVIVYNPSTSQNEREIVKWYKYFIKQQKLKDSQCILLAHHKPDTDPTTTEWQAPTALQNIQCIHTNLEDDPNMVKDVFKTFVIELVTILRERQEKEELGIVGDRKK